MTDSNKRPTYEARERGDNVWNIAMRIPMDGGGCTIESILDVKDNCGVAPAEAEIAFRVAALLNMAEHIPTEDLQIKGASLKLQTFSERMAAQSGCEADLTDREKDLRDTNESLRRSLLIIGNKFGVKLSANSNLFAGKIVEEFEALQARFSQADFPLTELREIIGKPDATPASLMTYVRNLSENAMAADPNFFGSAASKLEHIEKLLIEHEHHTKGDDLWASVDKLIDRVLVLEDEDGSNLVNVSRALDEAREANKETAGQLAKADQELATVRGNLHLVGQALKDNGTYPTIVELAHARMEDLKDLSSSALQAKQECANRAAVIDELNEFKTRALVLHDNICDLLGDSRDPGGELVPFAILFERLDDKFNAPRVALNTMMANFELEVADDWRDNVSELYSFIKGLSVAQYKNDTHLQTLLRERNTDRAIIGAIDDLCGDVTNRPTVPVMAAIRALVQSHINAIHSKEKTHG